MTEPVFADEAITLYQADSLALLGELPAESVDSVVTDPPYGLEFMGKTWDAFRLDDPGTMRHRGDNLGSQGTVKASNATLPAAGRVEIGGGKRPTTSRCSGCGKRDQFRNEHGCVPGARWITEPIDRYAAPPTSVAFAEWCRTWALEAYRVAKPGAHLLAFGGTRTYHRLAAGLEDAGWEIRDCLVWAYAQGFPKSLNVGKAIDKLGGAAAAFTTFRDACLAAMTEHGVTRRQVDEALGNAMASHYLTNGTQPALPNRTDYLALRELLHLGDRFDPEFLEEAEREVVGERDVSAFVFAPGQGGKGGATIQETAPATPAAATWDGWGTALKPAWEPIVLARKPLSASVAVNVLTHGTGALNIDGTRIPYVSDEDREQALEGDAFRRTPDGEENGWTRPWMQDPERVAQVNAESKARAQGGRWPANVVLTDPILDGDAEGVIGGGESTVGASWQDRERGEGPGILEGQTQVGRITLEPGTYSRFFLIPKADKGEREPVLGGLAEGFAPTMGNGIGAREHDPADPRSYRQNVHPTVKPLDLMRHLVRLVTPPGGVVLDPFLGSGTTLLAAVNEGMRGVGIEREAEYVVIARARLRGVQVGLGLDGPPAAVPRRSTRAAARRPVEAEQPAFELLGGRTCPVHTSTPEPCPECEAMIAGGL